MPSRSVRSAAAVALAISASTVAYAGSATPAQAAGYNGYCKTSAGVTVVVDFRGLGGGIAIRCAPVGSGATGLDALQAAGIPVQQPLHWPGAVCRLYGQPAASTTLPGGSHEQCVNMPSGDAHWWYEKAPNGGSWSSSSEGMASSHVIPGGFEGWAFSEGGTNYAPRVTPSRPAAPQPRPTRTSSTAPAPRHTTTAPQHSTAPRHDPAPTQHTGGSQPRSTAASTVPSKTASGKKTSASRSASPSRPATSSSSTSSRASSHSASSAGGVTGTSSGGPTAGAAAAGAPVANSDELIKNSDKASGVNATTVVGGIVLAAVVIGGGAVAIIRRRNLR